MSQCKSIALFDSADIKLSTCSYCGQINLQFKNLLCTFNMPAFEAFKACILNLTFEANNKVNFSSSQQQYIVQTSHKDIRFCLSEEEAEALKMAVQEASLMMEVQSLLQTN